MSSQTRRQKILKLLDEIEEADIRLLTEKLAVSEITIRRDLKSLAGDGMLYRTHGGATKVNPHIDVKTFQNKTAVNAKVKDDICRLAATQITDDDIIFMDCGSTVFRLCRFIKQKNIKVITNSIPVVTELFGSKVSVNLIGGEVDQDRQAVHGKIAEKHISSYKATKAFLGIDGISLNGLFASSELEAANTFAMATHSSQNYILCDASKIGKELYLKFAELSLIDTLITNADEITTAGFDDKRINVLTVKS